MSILSGLSAPITTSQAATSVSTAATTVLGDDETDLETGLVETSSADQADETVSANETTIEDTTAIPASTDTVTPTESASSETDTSEQFDTFLRLLTAQIQNQDPLAPLDSTQFVEQLATFSNLELQAQGNQTLESIATMLADNLYRLDEAASTTS